MQKIIDKWHERREDYALQVVPEHYRKWGLPSLFGVTLSVSTALIYFALGGGFVLAYGTKPLLIAMIISTLFIGTVGYILTKTTAKAGIDSDLLSISSGFGYKGSGVTSLIYAANFPIFFALEGSIMATAFNAQFHFIPLWILYIFFGIIFIPITWYGMTIMNYVMWITLPIYLILLSATVGATSHSAHLVNFWNYTPSHPASVGGLAIIQILATMLAFIINASNSGDIGRFMQKKHTSIASLVLGYGYEAITFLGATMIGAWFGLQLKQANPGIYLPALLGIWGTLFVIISQLRINVLNTYSGSLAFANFFSRIFGIKPGRHWMVILVVLISIILMFAGVLPHINQVLTFEGIFTMSWIMAITSDITINKKLLHLSPHTFEIAKEKVPTYNPTGLISLTVALAIALPMVFGTFGANGQTLAPFAAGIIAFVMMPISAIIKNRFQRLKK